MYEEEREKSKRVGEIEREEGERERTMASCLICCHGRQMENKQTEGVLTHVASSHPSRSEPRWSASSSQGVRLLHSKLPIISTVVPQHYSDRWTVRRYSDT